MLSVSTIQRQRKRARLEIAKQINDEFNRNELYVLHWDGKSVKDSKKKRS